MAECVRCPFCSEALLKDAGDLVRVPAIIREFQREKFTVWRCPSCGSLHCKEDVDLDSYYRVYPFSKQKLDFWGTVSCRNRMRQMEREGVTPDFSILDFGCAGGVFVSFLLQNGYKDVSGYDAFVPEFNDPALLERRYDAVLAQDVLEHAEDPREMLALLTKSLKPGGVLYIGTPLADAISLKKHDAFAMSLHQPYHRHIFSRQALLKITAEQGLTPGTISDRHCVDTLTPTVNLRFLHEFVRHSGNLVNVAFEPPQPDLLWRHPSLLFYAFFGYFASRRSEVSAFFHLA